MAWNHDDVAPNRSHDELLGEVVRRGEGLRRRRRAFTGLGGCITLLLAVAGVAAVVGPGGEPATNLAAGGPTTTISGAVFGPATGGTVFGVEAPTTTAATDAPATTVARPVATTAVEPTVPDPTVPAPTVTTTPPPVRPRCSPDQMEITLTFAPSYRPGEQVAGQAVLRNRSGAPCFYYSYTQSQEFKNTAGTPVSPGSALIADAFDETAFAPAQTLSAAPTWDQKLCVSDPSCPQAPPGTYSATVSWSFDGPPITATGTFLLVP